MPSIILKGLSDIKNTGFQEFLVFFKVDVPKAFDCFAKLFNIVLVGKIMCAFPGTVCMICFLQFSPA